MVEVAFQVDRNASRFLVAGRKEQSIGVELEALESARSLHDHGMPDQKVSEGPGPAQDPIGVAPHLDVAQGPGVGAEGIRRGDPILRRQDDVSALLKLMNEEIVR